ncbi:ABC transporter ATP-binding protein [Streptosporangium lutulentum]|uniref:Branched-chain amino acid transport system ATP-binding protein n=1 Tax=Streptosporangium lutulentum TaxID=1461250 RepID=A0ABT9QJU0_9ACTN|nr:ABC transporter ATP-binding protein [Streptosporangium lutulentum]MDP9847016.1 branched-chain amino acid transport system ATP-binding protein [Streptosporangium lutulentum]
MMTTEPSPILRASGISVRYGLATAVATCSLEIARGSYVCLLGRNGAGKTSLVSALAGALPRDGRMWFDGHEVATSKSTWLARNGMLVIPEGRHLYPSLTVEDNLVLGAYAWTRSAREARRAPELEQVYDLFPRLAQRKRQLAGTMSGGEQQMVALGRALMGRPRLLMLDEPSLGLSEAMIEKTYEVLRDLRATGLSVLLVEESPHRALELCDVGIVMSSGSIIAERPTAELLAPGVLESYYLGTKAA